MYDTIVKNFLVKQMISVWLEKIIIFALTKIMMDD